MEPKEEEEKEEEEEEEETKEEDGIQLILLFNYLTRSIYISRM